MSCSKLMRNSSSVNMNMNSSGRHSNDNIKSLKADLLSKKGGNKVIELSNIEKSQRKKKIICEKLSVIIYKNNSCFFKERGFTLENLISFLSEQIVFEKISDFSYTKMLKKFEEKAIEKASQMEVIYQSFTFRKTSVKDSKHSRANLSIDQNEMELTKDLNLNLNNKTTFAWLKDKNRSTGDIFSAFKKEASMEKVEELRIKEKDEWAKIEKVIGEMYVKERNNLLQTQKSKRIDVKNYLLKQISGKKDEREEETKQKMNELKNERKNFSEFIESEKKKKEMSKIKQLKIKDDMDKILNDKEQIKKHLSEEERRFDLEVIKKRNSL